MFLYEQTTKLLMKKRVAQKKETIVISLGGSLICPKEVDIKFLKTIITLIKKQQKGKRIIIITGGGYFCRKYITAFGKVCIKKKSTQFKDNVGISLTRANATLVQQLLIASGIKAMPAQIGNPAKRINWKNYNVAVGAGYLPGHSTDYDAVLAAIANDAKTVINLTNIDYVYTKDPKKYKNAKPLKNLMWKDYKKVLKIKKWSAGLHTPFDPFASALAEKKKLSVIIVNGKKKKNLKSALGKTPIGTRIS